MATWVAGLRNPRKKLSAEQTARLESLGFERTPRKSNWNAMFAELKQYKERFGDCNVSHCWAENPQLGRWVDKQRQRQRAGKMSAERKAHLDTFGFEWALRASTWSAFFEELKRFKESAGHCKVPRSSANSQFISWMARQRERQRNGTLSAERKARLDALGFEWLGKKTR